MAKSYKEELYAIITKLENSIYSKDVILRNEENLFKQEFILTEIKIYSQKMKKAYEYLEALSRTMCADSIHFIDDINIFIIVES